MPSRNVEQISIVDLKRGDFGGMALKLSSELSRVVVEQLELPFVVADNEALALLDGLEHSDVPLLIRQAFENLVYSARS